MALFRVAEEGVLLVEEEMPVRVAFLVEVDLVLALLREVQEVPGGAACRPGVGVEVQNEQRERESTKAIGQAIIGNKRFDVGQSKTMLTDQRPIRRRR